MHFAIWRNISGWRIAMLRRGVTLLLTQQSVHVFVRRSCCEGPENGRASYVRRGAWAAAGGPGIASHMDLPVQVSDRRRHATGVDWPLALDVADRRGRRMGAVARVARLWSGSVRKQARQAHRCDDR